MNKKCIVYINEEGKYKCGYYQGFYCSIKCYKEHIKICNEKNKVKYEKEEKEKTNNIQPLNLDEKEDIILTEKELCNLKNNKSIMTKIKNKN